jgi:hypothetical protein
MGFHRRRPTAPLRGHEPTVARSDTLRRNCRAVAATVTQERRFNCHRAATCAWSAFASSRAVSGEIATTMPMSSKLVAAGGHN